MNFATVSPRDSWRRPRQIGPVESAACAVALAALPAPVTALELDDPGEPPLSIAFGHNLQELALASPGRQRKLVVGERRSDGPERPLQAGISLVPLEITQIVT